MDQFRRFVAPGQNRLLSAMSREVQLRLLPRMEKVSLAIRHVLYEADTPITHVWFPLSGVVSLVLTMRDGTSVEVGTVGNEGMVGTAVLLGAERTPVKAFCQVAGQAMKLRVDGLKRSLQEQPEQPELLRRYTQTMINQIAQSTACNHVHSVQQRMCRWLLMTHDRVTRGCARSSTACWDRFRCRSLAQPLQRLRRRTATLHTALSPWTTGWAVRPVRHSTSVVHPDAL